MTGGGRPPRLPRERPGRGARDDVPQLSDEEVQRRIEQRGRDAGAAARGPDQDAQPWGTVANDRVEEPEGSELAETQAVVRDPDPAADDRRRLLWRDSATILIGVVFALLVGQTLFPQGIGTPSSSATELPSTVGIGTFGPPISLPPERTFGPIIDPSLGIDATPTPIPVITMGPTPTPSPTPSPSVRPSGSIKPSPKPTKTPIPSKTPTPAPSKTPPPPTPSPQPTPTPEPTVTVACTVIAPLTVDCTATSAHIQAGSQNWVTTGTPVAETGGDGSASVTYTYDSAGTYTITVVVTGLDGSTNATDSATVPVT